jgi:hypothetical protein
VAEHGGNGQHTEATAASKLLELREESNLLRGLCV